MHELRRNTVGACSGKNQRRLSRSRTGFPNMILRFLIGCMVCFSPVGLTVLVNRLFEVDDVRIPCHLRVKLVAGSQNYMSLKITENDEKIHHRVLVGKFNNFHLADGFEIDTFKIVEYYDGKPYDRFPWLRPELEAIVNAEPPKLNTILMSDKETRLESHFDGILFHENKKQTTEPPFVSTGDVK